MENHRSLELTKEEKLVLLLSRVSFNKDEIDCMKKIMEDEVNWAEIFRIATKNRIWGLVYSNLEYYRLLYLVPSRYRRNGLFNYLGIAERNNAFTVEYNKIIKRLAQEGIKGTPLKGISLISNTYKRFGSRDLNDIDILINKKSGSKIIEIMESLGYTQGRYNTEKNQIERYTKEKKMLWKMKMNNLPPFVKKSESKYFEYYKVDFSFNLDLEIKEDPVAEMLNQAKVEYGNYFLIQQDFFLHLCCHLYKEATSAEWIYINSDINLVKFCDVREYIMQHMDNEKLEAAIEFAKKYNLEKSIYFTVYYLREIYNDGYEDDLLKKLNVGDESILNHYGHRNFNVPVSWKKTFWQRLFSDTNKDELEHNLEFAKQFTGYLNL